MNTVELRKAAEAATPGPWFANAETVFGSADDPERGPISPWLAETEKVADAEFIAAANPSAVLALLAENEELQRVLTVVQQLMSPEATLAALGVTADDETPVDLDYLLRVQEYSLERTAAVRAALTVPTLNGEN